MITVHQIVLRGGLFCFGLDTPGPQFREISRERGRRSPAGRSQRLRPPWGPHTFARRSEEAGRGCSPSGSSFGRRRTPRAGGCGAPGGERRRLAGTRGQTADVHRGKAGLPGAKAGRLAGKRRTVGAFRAASGARHRAETGKTGRRRGCIGSFWRVFGAHSGVNGAEMAAFRGCRRKKGWEKPSTRRASGGKQGAARRFTDGV